MKAHFSTQFRSVVRPAAAVLLGLVLSGPAHAVDGCKLLLCLAGSWQNISQCTPTVRQALRDLALGRVWPTCGMAGDSGSANQFVVPEQCPEQYISDEGNDESGRPIRTCRFSGVIHVAVQGQPWARTWWSMSGEAVTEWLPAARAAFTSSPGWMDGLEGRFDRDHAAWLVGQRARPAPEPTPAAEGGA